ncbi:MAG: bifunctional [glutamate--ammonia ligase]-adenylyl-L-tyrosine phosphorylase/[glutamate--ammonia-ligase] adenylyltransferase [Thermodesulfobacteriota bacterium]
MSKIPVYPDIESAKNTVLRFREINGSIPKTQEGILLIISSHSRFLGNSIIKSPDILKVLTNKKLLEKKKTFSVYKKSLLSVIKGCSDCDDLDKRLRKFKYKELARIIYREILGLSEFRHTLEELSDLASSIVETVLNYHRTKLDDSNEFDFLVLGMGKLGGRLLNLSSDIDLIYLFDNENLGDSVFKLAENVTRSLSTITEDGFLYRVDLGLRPGGSRSTIAVSVEGAVEHYYYWGDTWERAALLQARPIAGDTKLGTRYLKEIEDFVYRKSLDYASIEDLKDMKIKLNRLQKKRDVKLGRGGIREIEFFAQALQLVNGGAIKELRSLNTIDALKAMYKTNLITEDVKYELIDSYFFLRKVEHSIQLFDELQTHKLPSDDSALRRLSLRLGFNNINDFELEYKKFTGLVTKNYEHLFYDANKTIYEVGREFWQLADFLTVGDVGEDEAIDNLEKMGFKYPSEAMEIISLLLDTRRGGLTEKGKVLRRKIVPAFLSKIIKTHNPDQALISFERFISSIGFRTSIYSVLCENPAIIDILAKLFSRSGFLSSFLIRYPEYLDTIVLKNVRREYKDKEEMILALKDFIDLEDDFEDKLNTLRRFKNVESLKLCFRDLNEEVDLEYVGKYLSLIAKSVMECGLGLARDYMKVSKAEKIKLKNMLILGLGKLGGGEMSYNSDLDIIFIYEGEDHELFSKFGQRFISNLSVPTSDGYCYKIDLGLRPSGNAGALVTSFESFKEYHKSSAQIWERQSLIKAFPSAGNKELGKKVMKVINKFVYERKLDENFYEEIYRIRGRMENELAKESSEKVNIKTGKGGLVDIEFLVQMLQLRHGRKYSELRLTNTIESLNKLFELKLVSEKDFNILNGGYLFLKKLENLLRLLNNRSINDMKSSDFDKIASEFGEGFNANSLKKRYDRITSGIRKVYNSYFLEGISG